MTDERPWGPLDPNTQHQLWSRWDALIVSPEPTRRPPLNEVVENARCYVALAFKSRMGRVRGEQSGARYRLVVEIEGPPAHDPGYVGAWRRDFLRRFVRQGFGPSADLVRLEVSILAGDAQDGSPPSQVIVLPHLDARAMLAERR